MAAGVWTVFRDCGESSTLMQWTAACLASWFSVDGPLSPDCSAPLSVSQLKTLSTADSPLNVTHEEKMSFYSMAS